MTYDALAANGGMVQRSRTLGGWFRLLFSDRRILVSWILFVAASLAFACLLINGFDDSDNAPPFDRILLTSAGAGYWAWSMYWGVPGCIAILRRLWRYAFFGFSMIGLTVMGIFFVVAFIALVYYPPFGGGVFHFLRRWWTSGRATAMTDVLPNAVPATAYGMISAVAPTAASLGSVPPVAMQSAPIQPAPTPPTPMLPIAAPVAVEQPSDLELRLRELTRLLERGVISRDEHDRRRLSILDKI